MIVITDKHRELILERQLYVREHCQHVVSHPLWNVLRTTIPAAAGAVQESRLLMLIGMSIDSDGEHLLNDLVWRSVVAELNINWRIHRENIALDAWSSLRTRMLEEFFATNRTRDEDLVALHGEGWTPIEVDGFPSFAGLSADQCYDFLYGAGVEPEQLPALNYRGIEFIVTAGTVETRQLHAPDNGVPPYHYSRAQTGHVDWLTVSLDGLITAAPPADAGIDMYGTLIHVTDGHQRVASAILTIDVRTA